MKNTRKVAPKKKSVSKPVGVIKLAQAGVRPNTASLRGREAGTSTRNAAGKQVGSMARRAAGPVKGDIMKGVTPKTRKTKLVGGRPAMAKKKAAKRRGK